MALRYDPEKSKFGNAVVWMTDALEKLDALAERYGIREDSAESKWFMLALNLAAEHEPGFAPRKTPGRKPKRITSDVILFLELWGAEAMGKSVQNRALQLTKPSSNWPMFRGKNPDHLRTRSYLLKNPSTKEGKRLRKMVDDLGSDPRTAKFARILSAALATPIPRKGAARNEAMRSFAKKVVG